MQHRSNFRLGLFIIGTLILGAALLIGIGSGRWWQPKIMLETYFDESVRGLDVGSKVRYRGVAVGEVSAITFTYNRYEGELPNTQRKQYVLVEATLQNALFGKHDLNNAQQQELDGEIAKGLRVKLAPQGLTGTSYLEIDYVSNADQHTLPFAWKPKYLYIPSTNSTVNQILGSAQDLMAKLQRVDLDKTVDLVNQTLITMNQKLQDIPTKQLSQQTSQLLGTINAMPLAQIASESSQLISEARETNQALKTILEQPALRTASNDFASAAHSAKTLLASPELASAVQRIDKITLRLDHLSAQREGDLQQIIDNLSSTSANLKALSEKANQRPSSLLFAEPPKPYIPPKP
ncbi:MCE family protein [Chitinibacter bivalviorum]|uniref:MCE family protein n=1 Tax=Chitinibacter bivalviorum TaxID=2739434 RepID=A0A7H9BEA8_9NEIS|nr:MlaD family protein [Chitinibacter bivalviorum]QLG86782.1 MCE family protein [Chitinibacter bivalviorum]